MTPRASDDGSAGSGERPLLAACRRFIEEDLRLDKPTTTIANAVAFLHEADRLQTRNRKLVEAMREAARRSESDRFERVTVADFLRAKIEENGNGE